MKLGSSSLFSPKTSSLREYLAPFITWHLSPVTYYSTNIFPSQGDETVFGSSIGNGLVILLVKKELNVEYSLRAS